MGSKAHGHFLDTLFQNFRSVECQYCKKHMGLQGRNSNMIAYCSAVCLEIMMNTDGSVIVNVTSSAPARLDAIDGGDTAVQGQPAMPPVAPANLVSSAPAPAEKVNIAPRASVPLEKVNAAPIASAPVTQVKTTASTPAQVAVDAVKVPSAFAPVAQAKAVPSAAAPDAPTKVVASAPAPVAQAKVVPSAPAPVAPAKVVPSAPAPVAPAKVVPSAPAPVAPAKVVPSAPAPVAPPKVVPSAPASVAQAKVAPSVPAPPDSKSAAQDESFGRKVYMLKEMQLNPVFTQGAKVFVAFIYDGSKFHVCSEDQAEQFAVQTKIAAAITNKELDKLGGVPVVGEIVIGEYAGEYYRALVTAVDVEKRKASLEYVDFGDKGTAVFDELFAPNEELMKEPVHGLALKVYGITPGTKCPTSISDLLSKEAVTIKFKNGVPGYGDEVVFGTTSGTGTINQLIFCETFKEDEIEQA